MRDEGGERPRMLGELARRHARGVREQGGEIDHPDAEWEAHGEGEDRPARELRAPGHERHAEAGNRSELGATTIAPMISVGWPRATPTAAITSRSP